ncbi:YoaK family protein [Streptomyces sp. bgisy100]|uniref:YoaK family protein n=1 Tax=Streptomyces sp. bgisy100 TaxID=3413783 RepID=UPI003D75F1F7
MQATRGTLLVVAMVALTVTTGMIEAVSFLALGQVFTAMQTGNLLFLGFALAGEGGLSAAASGLSLGAFAVGAVLGARLEAEADAVRRRWFLGGLLTEAVLLGGAALVAWGSDRSGEPLTTHRYALITLMALAMGLRNVTTLRAGVPDLPTTVETRALTALLNGPPVGRTPGAGEAVHPALRRTASVAAMFTGGLVGAWLLHEGRHAPGVLLVAAVVVLAVALVYGAAPRRPPGGEG